MSIRHENKMILEQLKVIKQQVILTSSSVTVTLHFIY